jgi:hypothetical protein
MLTKRESEEPKRKEFNKYEVMVIKLREILLKYQKKVVQLKEEKEFYRLKLRKERRKKGNC